MSSEAFGRLRISFMLLLILGVGGGGCAADLMRGDVGVEAGRGQVHSPPSSVDDLEQALNAMRDLDADTPRETVRRKLDLARREMATIREPGELVAARLHLARSLDLWSLALEGRGDARRRWIPVIDQALEELEQIVSLIGDGDAASLSLAQGYRDGLLVRRGEDEAAFIANDAALLSALAAGRPELTARWGAQRGRLLMALDLEAPALSAFRAARLSLQTLGQETPSHERLSLAREILFPLSDLILRAPDPGEDQLREVQASLEDLRLAEVAELFGDACLAGLPKRRLDSIPGAVVLYPILLPDRIELIVGRGGRLDRRTVPVGLSDPFAALRRLRASLQDPTSFRFRRPASQFYDWLIRPLGALKPGEGETLVLVPTVEWMGLPLAALWNDDEERFLIEEMAVAITPGLELTSPAPMETREAQLLAAGLTIDVAGYAPLLNVEAEVEAVSGRFSSQRLVGPAYTSRALKKALASGDFDIIHIASHGVFDERREDGFIVTADGRLGFGELAETLRTTRFSQETRLDLLFLSACETAASSPRAAFGLAGVAIRSGAASAVASLWRVSDRATAVLIDRFYAELTSKGLSRAAALRRAQLALRSDVTFMHPFYWSSFILINDWL